MKSYSTTKQDNLQSVGNGQTFYRWNHKEVPTTNMDGTTGTQWQCDEVAVWNPTTKAKVKQAIIKDAWSTDEENKLINDFNAFNLGIIDYGLEEYKSFLSQRKAIKDMVEADTELIGIE